MQGFTKTLAIELGRFNVTANAIAPGFIQTDMTAATAEAHRRRLRRLHQDGRLPDPRGPGRTAEDIANTVAFLVSEGAGFMSGQVIYVAGGPKD